MILAMSQWGDDISVGMHHGLQEQPRNYCMQLLGLRKLFAGAGVTFGAVGVAATVDEGAGADDWSAIEV